MLSLKWTRPRREESGPPAVLMGHLNLIRALGLAEIPVVLIVADSEDLALRSRYVTGYCQIPPLKPEHEPEIASRLLSAGGELRAIYGTRVPLFYGNDEALGFIHRFRGHLERHYLLLLNSDELAQALSDKEEFYRICARKDLLVPRTLRLSSCGRAELESFEYPVILKPRAKAHWQKLKQHVFRDGSKARLIEQPGQLADDPALHRYADDLVVSQLIPGDDERLYSFHGLADEDGRLLAWFAGRKLRTYPASNGESSFIELIREPALVEVGKSFVTRLGVRGPFKIDMKKSSGDGLYYALEINARYNLWNYLGAVSGVNVLAIAYRHLLEGERARREARAALAAVEPQSRYRTGYRWVNFYLDYHTARDMRRRGEITYPRWLRSLIGRNLYSAFAWQDPLPFFKWASDFIIKKAVSS